MAQMDPYDCKNKGTIQQTTVNGLNVSYCKCLDLETSAGNYFTGPQCSYQVTIESSDV